MGWYLDYGDMIQPVGLVFVYFRLCSSVCVSGLAQRAATPFYTKQGHVSLCGGESLWVS